MISLPKHLKITLKGAMSTVHYLYLQIVSWFMCLNVFLCTKYQIKVVPWNCTNRVLNGCGYFGTYTPPGEGGGLNIKEISWKLVVKLLKEALSCCISSTITTGPLRATIMLMWPRINWLSLTPLLWSMQNTRLAVPDHSKC